MTLLELPAPAVFPSDIVYGEGGLQANWNFNATNVKLAFIYTPQRSANALSIFTRSSTVTTFQQYRIGLQSVTSTGGLGKPSGTWLGSTGNGYATVTAHATNTTIESTLGQSVALTRGVPVAVVMEWVSTTGIMSLIQRYNPVMSVCPVWAHFGNCNLVYTSSWGVATYGVNHVFAVRTDATNWSDPSLVVPATTPSWTQTRNSGATPDEIGNRVKLPAGRVDGVIFHSDIDAGLDCVLYDNSNNVVASVSNDGTLRPVDTYNAYWLPFTTPYTAAAGWYRIVLKPTTTTNVRRLTAAYDANAVAGLSMGSDCYLTQRTDGGAWTDTPGSLAQISVAMGAIELSSGGLPAGRIVSGGV